MANVGVGTYEVDPISRIEGHLGVKVTTDASGIITDAKAHGNLWRGFENFLLGREVNDAITFTQRICGVCPVPHGLTATYAADTVLGYSKGHITFADDGTWGIPKKAVHMRNLVLGAEYLMSSITHFYHLAAPSYVQGPNIPPWTPYFDTSYYHPLLENQVLDRTLPSAGVDGKFSDTLWSTVIRSYVKALRIRRLTFEAGALFAGRMPMTSCFIGGGVTFDATEDITTRCTKFKSVMEEVGLFIIREYMPIALALGILYPDFDNAQDTTGGNGYGAGLGNFLSWGAFPDPDTHGLLLKGGVYTGGQAGSAVFTVANKAQVESEFLAGGANAVPDNLTEDIKYSRYSNTVQGDADVAYPGNVDRTMPERGKTGAYTYMRAPRWNNQAMEVGPFARLVVSGLYPVDGTALNTVDLTGLGFSDYFDYTDTVNSVFGLDPAMIEPDIAVALVREGAAILRVWTGAAWVDVDDTVIDTLTTAQITEAYTGTGAYAGTDAIIVDGVGVPGVITGIIGLEGGLSTIDRLRARAIESFVLVQAMIGGFTKGSSVLGGTWGSGWIDTLQGLGAATPGVYDDAKSTWKNKAIPTVEKQGWGGTEAPRGALMHQCTIVAGKITAYQCIVPTTWNGSPKDTLENYGAIEAACIGAPFKSEGGVYAQQVDGAAVTTMGGVEVLRIAQSFDPCIACAVH